MKKIIKITIAFLSVFAFLSAGIAETKKTKIIQITIPITT